MFFQLPPAGNKIDCHSYSDGASGIVSYFPADTYFFNSGAASLAAVVLAAVQRSNFERPEVLLPAYACPELVSAVLYAGARPVLVDLEADRCWMDLNALAENMTAQTCAVIAVSLFGIPERLGRIRKVLGNRDIWLIEDSAQAFPEAGVSDVERGDITIYSFGRGKPVSVLAGGAALVWDASKCEAIAHIHAAAAPCKTAKWKARLKIAAYNRLLSPLLYWLPNKLPFIQLGATIFHPLDDIKKMSAYEFSLLGRNIEAYWQRDRTAQNLLETRITQRNKRDVIIDLAAVSCDGTVPRLLRYPLLAAGLEQRNELCEALNRKGLGASKMYPSTLKTINGLEGLFKASAEVPNAEDFSQRILTLPIHSGVKEKEIDEMLNVIAPPFI